MTSRHRSRRYLALLAVAMVAMAALASAGVTRRAALAASIALLAHLDWIWIPAAIVLESASMAALSSMQRRLLAAGGTNVGVRPMLATTFAANALSVSVPLAGPELGTVFMFRRFTRQGADAPLAVQAWADRLGSLRLPASGWMTVTSLALANWLADVAVFALSIHAAGATVPWHFLLLAYGSGVAAQNLNITPGGFGITEGTLSLTLAAAGLRASQALAAVLLYRLVSFWLVAGAGWLTFLWLRAGSATRAGPKQDAAAAGDAADTGSTGELRPHELVLLHGQPGSMADWQQVIALLPAQLRVVAADRPGYGSNPQPAGGFAANARAVLDLLDSRGIKQAVLVGHSYGGGVALSAASMAPHRVEAVVLLASEVRDA